MKDSSNAVHTHSAVVLSCKGGDQGDLGLVRSLGREGVPVVFVTENPRAHSLASKYIDSSIFVNSFKANPRQVIDKLVAYARDRVHKPVLFPTADPDLELVSEYRDDLSEYYHFTMPSRKIVETFLDKSRFFGFGQEKFFPLPATFTPSPEQSIETIAARVDYPAILKPLNPKAWSRGRIQEMVNSKKALVVDSADELVQRFNAIAAYDSSMVVQEYIPGRDDRLYSVHIYMGKNGEPLGSFVGRKIRTYPAYAGIGCFVISEFNQALVDISVDILRKSAYLGLALLQFKKDPDSGRFVLLEINARTSSWNQLALVCGVNLPYMAYLDVLDKPVPTASAQRNDVKYIYFKPDVIALSEYRKTGDWSFSSWIKSYSGRKTFQLFCIDDPFPFIKVFGRDLQSFFGSLLNKLFRFR
ncbi:MAG: ATP-grasp domain-containing protein [Exilibacterium sp.]